MSQSEAPTRLPSPVVEQEDAASAQKASRGFASAWTDPPPASAEEDPLIGATLSRTYHVTRVLGEGGMGRVYEAWHTRIKKKRYAVKVLHPEFARSSDVLGRFQREAEAAACLSHPNAVGVYDVALTPQGWPYLVCEYLEGVDLSEHLRQHGPLSPATARHIALQVCDALVEAHALGVIHRDLKPQNVYLLGQYSEGVPAEPNAKVLDFGLSRFLDGGDSELTKTGVIMGTPSYMAPEQARGERVDHRCDVYGVGALLYTAVTGRPPFKTETPQATILAVMNEEPPRPRSLKPQLPVALEFLIQRAMAKDPSQRYPDMKSLRAALYELDMGGRSPGTGSPDPSAGLGSFGARGSEMKSARLNFLLYGALSLLTLFAGFSTALVGGVVLGAGRWPFSRLETTLALLVVVGTLLTPSLLLIRKLRKSVWDNTARVFAVLQQMREAVTLALFAYGVGALSWLFLDNVLVHFVDMPQLASTSGLRWPGTPLVLLAAAIWLSAGSLLRTQLAQPGAWIDRAKDDGARRWRRFFAGPCLTVFSALGVSAFVVFGALWRSDAFADRRAGAPVEISPAPPDVTSPEATAGRVVSSAPSAELPTLPPEPTVPPQQAIVAPNSQDLALATPEELSAAISQGEEALSVLQTRYPNDPKVLRATAMAYASKSAGLLTAARVLRQLFSVSPQSVNDTDLQYLVQQMARTRGHASQEAFKLMATHMGSVGPDLLYKLSLSNSEQREQALAELARPETRRRFSAALSIAYELQFAESCSARLPLLQRAEQLGDDRAVRVLTSLSAERAKGCGPKKNQACKATCAAEARAFQKSAEVISARLRSHPSQP
jgi:serine/threonine-protein kinase